MHFYIIFFFSSSSSIVGNAGDSDVNINALCCEYFELINLHRKYCRHTCNTLHDIAHIVIINEKRENLSVFLDRHNIFISICHFFNSHSVSFFFFCFGRYQRGTCIKSFTGHKFHIFFFASHEWFFDFYELKLDPFIFIYLFIFWSFIDLSVNFLRFFKWIVHHHHKYHKNHHRCCSFSKETNKTYQILCSLPVYFLFSISKRNFIHNCPLIVTGKEPIGSVTSSDFITYGFHGPGP